MNSSVLTMFAALPIIGSLVLLIGFKMSSLRVAVGAYVLCVLLALAPFVYHTPISLVGEASVKGLLTSITIVCVLVFGLFMYNVLDSTGAMATISTSITRYCVGPVEQALLISAALGPFLEATSGFGIGIVIAAPMYLALGFSNQKAAMLSLLTQTAVPWGALAVGTVINAQLSDVSLHALGVTSAIVNIPLYLFYTISVVVIAGGWSAIRPNFATILTVWCLLSFTTWFTNAFIATQLGAVLAGAFTSLVLVCCWRLIPKRLNGQVQLISGAQTSSAVRKMSLGKSIVPYVVLILYLLGANLVPNLRNAMSSILVLNLPSFGYRLEVLNNPGFALMLATIAGIWLYRLPWKTLCFCMQKTLKQAYPAVISTVGFIAMSSVMQQTGMIGLISTKLAVLFGASFIAISPLVGGLGGFITGSNTASNAMFAPFQSDMARQLHQPALLYATSQNVAAANMSFSSPARVSLVTAVSNQAGKEGELTRKILPLSIGGVAIVVLANLSLSMFLK